MSKKLQPRAVVVNGGIVYVETGSEKLFLNLVYNEEERNWNFQVTKTRTLEETEKLLEGKYSQSYSLYEILQKYFEEEIDVGISP